MIPLKTSEEISVMREGGKKLGNILQSLLKKSVVGVSLLDIEAYAQELIKEAGGTPSFATVEDYRWATCLCINEQVVHGIPRHYILKEGDVFTIDVGMLYGGFHTDTAWTIVVGLPDASESMKNQDLEKKRKLLNTGEKALWKAISAVRPGERVGNISKTIEDTIETAGYHVVKSLTGHGVGKVLHEEPFIPEFLKGSIERTALLTSGMTLAIEVIYATGKGSIAYEADGWTLSTIDKSLSAVFEHSVAITDEGTLLLTESPN